MNKTEKKIINFILLAFLTAQVLYLLWFNLFRFQYIVNFDSSEYLVQTMQIFRQKTLLIHDYYYSTMLTWDMPTLLAVVFYGITGNVFLAWGIADDILIIALLLTVFKTGKDIGYTRGETLLSACALFTLYAYGIVDYAEELFINGALYGFRILHMLLLMDILLCVHKRTAGVPEYLLLAWCMVFFFISGISTGVFEAGCCLLPIFAYEFLHALNTGEPVRIRDFLKQEILIPFAALVVSLCGVVVNKKLGLMESIAASKNTMPADRLASQFFNNIVGIFQFLGWKDGDVPLFSVKGILYVVCFCLAAFVIFCGLLAMGRAWRGIKKQEKEAADIYVGYLLLITLVNLALLSLVDLNYQAETFEYRYWSIVLVPTFLTIGLAHRWVAERVNDNFRRLFFGCYILGLMLVCAINGRWLAGENNGVETGKQAIATAEDNGVDTLFVYVDYFTSRLITTCAKDDMDVFAMNTSYIDAAKVEWVDDSFAMPKWGTYVKYDTDCTDNALSGYGILIDTTMEQDNDFLTAKSTAQIPVEGTTMEILVFDTNYVDFRYGVPEAGRTVSRDYFNHGYQLEGIEVGDSGYLKKSGHAAGITSKDFTAASDGTYQAILHYSGADAAGTMTITTSDGTLCETALTGSGIAESGEFHLKKGEAYSVDLALEKDCGMELDYIEFLRCE